MTTNELLVTLLLVLPMAGFLLSALIGRRLHTRAWIIAVPIIIATWLIAMYIVYETLFLGTFGEEGLALHDLHVDPRRQHSRSSSISRSTT